MSKTEPLAFVEPVSVGIGSVPATKCAPVPSAGSGLVAVKHGAAVWKLLLIGGAVLGGTALVSVGIAVAVVKSKPGGPDPVDPVEPIGGWTPWSRWTDCTATCGLSIRTRARECEGVVLCDGPENQVEDCYDQSCPKTEYGIWSAWTGWSGCSATCASSDTTGVQKKSRVCNQQEGQQACPGSSEFSRTCNSFDCPDCSRQCPGGGVIRRPECLRCWCPLNRFSGRVTTIYNLPLEGVRVSDAVLPIVALAYTDANGMFTVKAACDGIRLLFREPGYLDETHVIGSSKRLIPRIKMRERESLQMAVQPEHKARLNGQTVTFCCNVGSDRPGVYYYEWFFNSRIISPYAYNLSNTLELTRLSQSDSGLYKCRASNDWTAVYSDDARLIVEKKPEDFCNPEPRPNNVNLPAGCTYMGLSYIDQGRCGTNMCQPPVKVGGNRQCRDSVQYCCDALSYKDVKVWCIGYSMKFYVVESCGCTVCSNPKVTITGTVYDAEDEQQTLPFISIYSNGTMLARSDLNGSFKFTVEQESRTLSVYAKDVWKNYAGAMRVIHIAPRRDGLMFVNLPMRRYSKGTIISAAKDNIISIGNPENAIGKLMIPANSFYTFAGIPFRGEASVSVILIDPRQHSDFFHRSADLSYIEREGNVLKMQTLGMFALKMRTKNGDIPLQVNGTVPLALDMNNYRAVNSNPKVSFLHPRFGVWERQIDMKAGSGSKFYVNPTNDDNKDANITTKFASLFGNNNFVYGELKLHPASEWISFDAELKELCHSKVRVFEDNRFQSSEVLAGTDVTVVSVRWDGTVSDVSNFRTFTDRNDQQGHCVVHHCDTDVPTEQIEGYIMAEAPNKSPLHFSRSRSIINTLLPASQSQLNWKGNELENFLNYNAYSIQGSKMVKVNLDFTQVERIGPFYDHTGENHDFRNWGYSEDCSFSTFNPKGANFFPFFSKLKVTNADKKCRDTKFIPVDEVRTSHSREQNYQAWFSRSELGKYDICYIKVLTSGIRLDQHVKATSFVGNVSYESIIAGKTIYGIDQACVQDPAEGRLDEEEVCLEFKHPGKITYGGPYGGKKTDETLVEVSAKPVFYGVFQRKCEISSIRQCLEKKFGHKITKPSNRFNQREFAMYVAEDTYGPDYGIYCSKASAERSISEVRLDTYRKCMDGGRGRVFTQCEGKDSDDPNSLGWAVKIKCDK